jgi:RNA polymerase sigma-70 factor (ECF subfamily)
MGMIRELRFKIICRRHSDEIYRFARSMLGGAADAEDATQEVLLRLWNSMPDIPLLQARAWLYRTSRNYCLDQIRRRCCVATPVPAGAEALEEIVDEGCGDPSRAADLDHLRSRMDAALQSLPELVRTVFILYEVNGLRYRQIAEQLEIPINSVKVHLLRARRKLQELLRQERIWTNS